MLEEIRQKILENNKKIQELVDTNRDLELEFSKILFIGKKVYCFPNNKTDKIAGTINGFFLSENNSEIILDVAYVDEEDDLITSRFTILEVTDY